MRYLLNIIYVVGLTLLSPVLLYRMMTTRKYRRGMLHKLNGRTGMAPRKDLHRPRLWFHAVSVGEVHLLRPILSCIRQRHSNWEIIISTTTDTGYDEARKCFVDSPVIFWPLDFSWAVARGLREVQPDLVVLVEGEMWPNFLLAARRQGVPVAVINGRMSPRSAGRYRKLATLARRLLSRVDLFAMQTDAYAEHLRVLGAPGERVQVTGNIKYDGVEHNRLNPRTSELRELLRVQDNDLVWIAGSTQAPEEELAVDIYRKLRIAFPSLRLFVVPRQKDRFDEVAGLLERSGLRYVRRSRLQRPLDDRQAIVLVDTIGELGALWGLADLAFVGGSLDGRRGGQNIIEPAAYGAAVVFGPHTWNFKADVERLLQAQAAVQIQDAPQLEEAMRELCADPAARRRQGDRARLLVEQQQGATDRTIRLLEQLLEKRGVALAA